MPEPTKFTTLQSNSSMRIGSSGDTISNIVTSVASVVFDSVTSQGGSQSTTVTMNEVRAGASVVAQPATSAYSGAYNALVFRAIASAASTVQITATNSGQTAVAPDLLNFRITAINF